jgi:PAS domain S-box-containing protein
VPEQLVADYGVIFEANLDGMVVVEHDTGLIVEVNPALCRMHGYTRDEVIGHHPRLLIHRDDLGLVQSCLDQAQSGHPSRVRARGARKDRTTFDIEFHGTMFRYNGRQRLLGTVRDVTAELEALRRMEQHVAQHEQEVAALLEVSRNVAAVLDIGPLMRLILDQLKLVANYAGSSIGIVEGEAIRIVESRGSSAEEREDDLIGALISFAGMGAIWERLSKREPVIVADMHSDEPFARAFRAMAGGRMDSPAVHYIRSWLAVPLIAGDRVTGVITLSRSEPGYYTAQHADLAMAFAAQAAVALENARLFERERAAQASAEHRLERATALGEITQRLLTATDRDTVLRVVAEAAHRLSGGLSAFIAMVDPGRRLRFAAGAGPLAATLEATFPAVDLRDAALAATAVGSVLVNGVTAVEEDSAAWPVASGAGDDSPVSGRGAFIAAPLQIGDDVAGLLWVGERRPRAFSMEEQALVEALADQAALAVEHDRLGARGREAAVLEERARLARDLHDSVTQSLFSLGMLAGAARTQYARNATTVDATLERIADLAQESLAEMRALLLELRPLALEAGGLGAALVKLAESFRGRSGIDIAYAADTDARSTPEAETAVFRIAQEALANAIRHAYATKISVRLSCVDGGLVTTVTDDGIGFDPAKPPVKERDVTSGGMGLRSMQERATAAGIDLHIDSGPGHGTTVRLIAPVALSMPLTD